MFKMLRALAVLTLAPSLAVAQGRPIVEIGTRLGATIQHVTGSTLTEISVPGAGILGQPTIYATFFATPEVFVEPDVAFNVITGGGSTVTTFGGSANIGYLIPTATPDAAPFVAASGALQHISGGGTSSTEGAVGGRVGYRFVVQSSFAVRLEAGYRRWFSSHVNEITIGLGLGGIIHSAK